MTSFKFVSSSIALTLCCFLRADAAEMTVDVGGRIQVDAALYDEDVTALASGTEFRRVRLFAAGGIDADWAYKLQVDFADGDADLEDVFIQYSGFDFGSLKIGNFKVPFGLEELTSSKYITFMERGMTNAFVPSRRIGVGATHISGAMTFSAAVYGDETDDSSSDEGIGVAGRFTIAPKHASGFWHFGAAALYEEPNNTDSGSNVERFRTRPESHVTGSRLVDTGSIAGVSGTTKLGLEAAAVFGAFSIQGEYIINSVDAAGGDVDFDGYYVYGSWFPGGETRRYDRGVFQRTKADRAWEVALRYSHISLDAGAVPGGEESNITVGVNYYVNPYLRFMANYVVTDVEGGVSGNEDPSVLQFRAAVDFK